MLCTPCEEYLDNSLCCVAGILGAAAQRPQLPPPSQRHRDHAAGDGCSSNRIPVPTVDLRTGKQLHAPCPTHPELGQGRHRHTQGRNIVNMML